MIGKILVPTDGSPLSERVIPLVEDIATAQLAKVVLVRVVSPPTYLVAQDAAYFDPDIYQELADAQDDEATAGLDRLAERLRAKSICTRTLLLHGSAYAALLDAEVEQGADLVMMATHGRTGLVRFVRGSVADSMLREGHAPVLMVGSFVQGADQIRTALVPLDGSELAESALREVESLAGKPLRAVELVRVIADELERTDAYAYLSGVRNRLEAAGLSVKEHVHLGDPTTIIGRLAEETDVIVMATHGRGGFDRWRYGSVATGLLATTPVPLLLVRARREVAKEYSHAAAPIGQMTQADGS
jgi:nucleotide-binding universal stress UspA family protein